MKLPNYLDHVEISARNRNAWAGIKVKSVAFPDLPATKAEAKPVKAAKKDKAVPTESQEQCAVIAWCDTQPLARFIFAIPNGANKSMAGAVKFKREGLRKGIPDLMLPIARNGFHGLFIELKRTKGSVTSKEQLAWIAFLNKQGFACFVCRGADEAINIIEGYLK